MQFKSDGGINIFHIFGSDYHWVDILSGPILVLLIIVWLVRKLLVYRMLRIEQTVMLGLTPPVTSKQTPYTTEQFDKILYSLGTSRTRREWLIGYRPVFSLELPSSRHEGIRYAVRIRADKAATFQQQLAAYVPNMRCDEIDDCLVPAISSGARIRIKDFTLARQYPFPLAAHDLLSQHDPIAYITHSMTKLNPDELIVYQLIVSACTPRSATRYRNTLHLGKMPNVYAPNRPPLMRLLFFIMTLPVKILGLILSMITDLTAPTDRRVRNPYQPAGQLSKEAQEMMASFSAKLAQPLFQVSIRAVVISEDESRSQRSMESITSAIRSLNVPGRQGLVGRRTFPSRLTFRYQLFCLEHRVPTFLLGSSCILSASELASLYHFPYGDGQDTEGLVTSLSHTLAVPIGLTGHADNNDFDVVLGMNKHQGGSTPIGLTADERARHTYVIGGTGNGKTTMLQYGIIQDIRNGKGVAVIDPHGDLAETILQHIPKNRINDVIYFNPSDADYPIGMNLLEIEEGLTGTDLLMAQDFVTEALVSVFRKIFSDDNTGGHRIEHALRYAVHTAFTVPGATLFTVRKLLINDSFRKQVIARLQDEDLKEFWTQEFAMAGSYQKYKKIDGVTTKIGRFERSVAARRILEQPKSTINFEDIIDNGKILICNLAKGKIGEDTSELFGTTILAKLQLAAYRRIRIPEAERRPFYLYVDEFQNFATPVFVEILSESRKYKLYITMAEQSTAQQEPEIVENILNNAGTVVCFRTSSPEDERYMLHQFQGSVNKGEVSSLSAFNFYMRIAAVKAQQPFSGETVLLEDQGSEQVADAMVAASRQNYAIKFEEASKSKEQPKTVATSPISKTPEMKTSKRQSSSKARKQKKQANTLERAIGEIDSLDDNQCDERQFGNQTKPGLADDDPVAG